MEVRKKKSKKSKNHGGEVKKLRKGKKEGKSCVKKTGKSK